MFMTPGLPFVPAIAITVNIYLIFKLHILTLVRFTIWMILGKLIHSFVIIFNNKLCFVGFIMYFCYGIKNSTLEEGSDGDQNNIELTVTDVEKPKYTPSSQYDPNADQNIYRYILISSILFYNQKMLHFLHFLR